MARLGDATWHLKRMTLGIKGVSHNYPCVGNDFMAHIKPCKS